MAFPAASSPSLSSAPTAVTSGSPPTTEPHPFLSLPARLQGAPRQLESRPPQGSTAKSCPHLAHPHLALPSPGSPFLARPPWPAAPQASRGQHPCSPSCREQGSPLTCSPLFPSTPAWGASRLLGCRCRAQPVCPRGARPWCPALSRLPTLGPTRALAPGQLWLLPREHAPHGSTSARRAARTGSRLVPAPFPSPPGLAGWPQH